MKRAAVILTSHERSPFYGIVTYDDDKQELDAALKEDFSERWKVPEGDSPDVWFEDILGDYTYFYIPMAAAKKLAGAEFPCRPSDAARALLDLLMISVCERFAYTSTFSRLA